MTFNEMNEAVREAGRTLRIADRFVREMLEICAGKLRASRVDAGVLAKLKDELRDYNIHTCKWRNK